MRAILAVAVVWGLCGSVLAQGGQKPSSEAIRQFEKQVRPLLIASCVSCHSADSTQGGLRLDQPISLEKAKAALARSKGEGGKPRMPLGSAPLGAEKIAALEAWVAQGASWPTPAAPARREVAPKRPHWAFQKVRPRLAPPVEGARTDIDAFLEAKRAAKGLKAASPASRAELIRRVTYDLVGLPPTPEEVQAFVADTQPGAWERLVDRLLASPHYGEKWGRHWLDLVRYAETNSYERDNPKPNAWRYRDYVIRAFNDDKPYDRFIKEQLAGDELPDGGNDGLLATGFYRLGIWDDEPTDREQARYDGIDDIVTTTGQTFLGLTIDCARCHSHKIDPIPQKDYYKLVAFFQNNHHFRNGGPTDERPLFYKPGDKESYEKQSAELAAKRQAAEAAVKAAKEGSEERKKLQAELDKLPHWVAWDRALCVSEPGPKVAETFVLGRGNPAAPGEKVAPGFLECLGGGTATLPTLPENAPTSGRRTILANWIASERNPLTARVMVNRIWQHHFGRGIVRSPNDYGLQGIRPTHPELLDWLATEFVRSGWSLKAMHRLILRSDAYKMASRPEPKALAKDPTNDLFWRFDMRRLTAEEIRDSLLAVNGTLNPALFGPSVYPEIPKEVLQGQSIPGYGWHTDRMTPADKCRRSVYVHVKRSLLYPILISFDLAETDRTTPVRFASTQPTQALGMLNSVFVNQQAALLAQRIVKDAGEDPRAQVRRALWLVAQRPPTEREITRGVRLMSQLEMDGAKPEQARAYFCLMALNLNEFVYLD